MIEFFSAGNKFWTTIVFNKTKKLEFVVGKIIKNKIWNVSKYFEIERYLGVQNKRGDSNL